MLLHFRKGHIYFVLGNDMFNAYFVADVFETIKYLQACSNCYCACYWGNLSILRDYLLGTSQEICSCSVWSSIFPWSEGVLFSFWSWVYYSLYSFNGLKNSDPIGKEAKKALDQNAVWQNIMLETVFSFVLYMFIGRELNGFFSNLSS